MFPRILTGFQRKHSAFPRKHSAFQRKQPRVPRILILPLQISIKKMAIPLQTPLKPADFLLLLGEKAGFEYESAIVRLQRTQQENHLVFSGLLLEEKGIFKRNE